jgi:hypothetical protein
MKKKERDQQRSALAGWDDEGGAVPSDRGLAAETQREQSVERADKRAAFDATHDSSARGEHRYPASNQTEAEQKTKRDRDALKRKLGSTR